MVTPRDPSFIDNKREIVRDLILRAKANPDDPAVVDGLVLLLGGFLGEFRTASDSLRRIADASEDVSKSLALITRELEAARTFRERERRGGR